MFTGRIHHYTTTWLKTSLVASSTKPVWYCPDSKQHLAIGDGFRDRRRYV